MCFACLFPEFKDHDDDDMMLRKARIVVSDLGKFRWRVIG